MNRLRTAMIFVIVSAAALFIASCDPIPPLHLRDGAAVETDLPIVEIDLDVMWHYDLAYEFGYESYYDWRKEWKYGWDAQDSAIFGSIGYTMPEAFNIRRYYHAYDTLSPRNQVLRDHVDGYKFRAQYQYGYYDFLVWNDIISSDGTQSVILDEESTLDSVTVVTNPTIYGSRYQAPSRIYSYNQPDELFSAEAENVYISRNYEDYDYYDEATHTYYKQLGMTLFPVVYIYLTQVIIHHNWGRVEGTDGMANFSNMAYSTSLNSGIAGKDAVTVHYNNRLKKDMPYDSLSTELVDIIGGRLTTFGIREINPFRYSNPLQIPEHIRKQRHYMDVNLIFGNGYDSTLVFDVTDQVMKRYRGGVITIELNMDTIPIPSRAGGSGFDAVVEEWVEETHEFEVNE